MKKEKKCDFKLKMKFLRVKKIFWNLKQSNMR